MTTSFYNGVSGLKTFQTGIDIWGDNIANVNTIAFKEKTPDFDTLFSKTLAGSFSDDLGMGSTVTTASLDLSQGSIISTDNPFDLALGGEGWFAVKRGDNTYYTRNGAFVRDAQGYLVDQDGNYLMVANANNLTQLPDGSYKVDPNKKPNIFGTLSSISLPNNVIFSAVPTSEATLKATLNDSPTLQTPQTPPNGSIDFNSLYDSSGNILNMQNSQDFVAGFGNEVTYDKGILSTTYCIYDDKVDGEDLNINFSVNGKEINLTLPDGSTKEEILSALSQELSDNGIDNSINSNEGSITISAPQTLIIDSNTPMIKSTAASVLTYNTNPQNEFEFSNPDELTKEMQALADVAYPNESKVSFEDGKINIQNLSDETLNTYIYSADNPNESFMDMLANLNKEVLPNSSNSSLEFTSNTQSFGGFIYDAQGNKDNISFTFTKSKIDGTKTNWLGNIEITDPNGNLISSVYQDFTFDGEGNLVSPKTLSLSQPQSFKIDLSNLKAYSTTQSSNAISYSFTQNGLAEGYLKGYNVDANGNIIGLFSNDQAVTLGQIPVFHFQNDQGLDNVGGNLFRETINSNKAFLYQSNGEYIPGASIISSSLESSNVQLSTAMTELIVTQKAYSASAKTVTTSDEMIQRAINMKR